MWVKHILFTIKKIKMTKAQQLKITESGSSSTLGAGGAAWSTGGKGK